MPEIISELKEKTKGEVEETPAADFFMGIVLMILSAVIIYIAWSWPRPTGMVSAAALFPLLIASTLFLMALTLLVTSLKHKGYLKLVHYLTIKYWREFLAGSSGKLFLLTFSTILVYMILLLNVLPFEAATLIYTAGSLYLFWKEKIYKILIISASVTAFYVISFRYFFKLVLPGSGM